MNIIGEEYPNNLLNNEKERRVMEVFQHYFKTYKINNPNLRNSYSSSKCCLTVKGKVTIAYGGTLYPKKTIKQYFDTCDEGYNDILKDLNLANDFINVMRHHKADTEENLVLAEEGIEDIRNEVNNKKKLLQTLRKETLNE